MTVFDNYCTCIWLTGLGEFVNKHDVVASYWLIQRELCVLFPVIGSSFQHCLFSRQMWLDMRLK